MSAKKKASKPSLPPKFERAKRPIVWIGGSGLPGGATGKKLIALGHPLHWEPGSSKAARSVATLQPVIVAVESERMSETLQALLFTLTELKSTIDMVVFQLRRREPRQIADGIDGLLLYGPALVQQIKTVLATMAGSGAFKATGLRAQKRLKKVRGELDRLRTLAVKDDLTCIYNLRFFNRSLENEHQRALRFGRCYSLIFIDLDGLREVNSRKGHLVGGQVLKQVAVFVMDRVRRIDLPARIGGDEFVVICPETAKPAARLVAERIRSGIESLQDSKGKPLDITAVLFFTLNREDFSFVIHLDRQPRTSRRREAQTGSRARSGSRSERTLDAVEHSRTLMEWWPFLIFHRGGLRIKVINNSEHRRRQLSRRRQPARRSSAARRPRALRSQIPRKEPRLQLGRLRGRWRRQELPGIGPPYSRRPDHRKARRERNDQLVPSRTETRILFTFWSKKISPQRRRVRGEEKGCLDLWLGSDFPGSSSALSASLRFKSFQVYLASP